MGVLQDSLDLLDLQHFYTDIAARQRAEQGFFVEVYARTDAYLFDRAFGADAEASARKLEALQADLAQKVSLAACWKVKHGQTCPLNSKRSYLANGA